MRTMKAAAALGSPGSDDPYLPHLEGVNFQPVFIIGQHRSGTTLLQRVLARSRLFNVVTVYHVLNRHRLLKAHFSGSEKQARDEVCCLLASKGILGAEHNSEALGPDYVEEYQFAFDHVGRRPILDDKSLPSFTRFCKKLQVIQEPGRPLLLKNPFDAANFLYIQDNFPHARYVFIYRHPAEIINSEMRALRKGFSQREEYAALRIPRYDRLSQNLLKLALVHFIYSERFPFLFRQVSSHVLSRCDYMVNNVDKLGAAAIQVTYPELCSNPGQVVARILTFLGLEETMPQDYAALIRCREPVLLPEVHRNLPWIERRCKSYLRKAGLEL